jgi:hypothetical protein
MSMFKTLITLVIPGHVDQLNLVHVWHETIAKRSDKNKIIIFNIFFLKLNQVSIKLKTN